MKQPRMGAPMESEPPDPRFRGASAREVVTFPDGLPGFESCRQFVLLSPEDGAPLGCLEALDTPHPSFLVIDPCTVLKRYRKVLNQADRLRLSVVDDDLLLWLAIVVLDQDESASVNLRAPIVINPRLMVGFQVIPHDSLYPLRHPLNL